MKQFRYLNKLEKSILDKILQVSFPGSEEIKKQIIDVKVRIIEYQDNYGSIEFKVNSNIQAFTNSNVPVEAVTKDVDGVPVEILIHMKENKINELEIIKADGTQLKSPIDINSLEVRPRND